MRKNTENELFLKKTREKDCEFRKGLLTGLIAAFFVAVLILGGKYIWDGRAAFGTASKRETEKKLEHINTLLEKYYLYEDETDTEQLDDGIYSGYVKALGDPYTEYYDEKATDELLESASGKFLGIGVILSQKAGEDEMTVVNVYENSPAEQAGIEQGDVLYAIDGEEINNEDMNTVISRIKGEEGTDVTITVLREGEKKDFSVTREVIEMQTVMYEMKEEQIGYIAVKEFDDVTYEQFKTALDTLEKQGMEGLIIDLRNNPGGNLTTVTDMLKLLLPEGPIVSIKDRYGNTEEIKCDGEHEFQKPLVVLVNQKSASASEIFSGAVKDYGTGEIVGMTTYGKGVVQQIFSLGDGTSIKITIAEYYTPSGNSINGTGVKPDVEAEYEYNPNDPSEDTQLEKAMEEILYLKKNKSQ